MDFFNISTHDRNFNKKWLISFKIINITDTVYAIVIIINSIEYQELTDVKKTKHLHDSYH